MNTPHVTIRPAEPADAAALEELVEQLGYLANSNETAERLSRVLASRGHEVLVAATPGELIIGWIHVFAAPRVESAGFAELGGLVVDTGHRRGGVGTLLIRSAEEWARNLGFATLRIRSRIDREESHDFFEHRGFKPIKTQRIYEKIVNEKQPHS